MVEIGPGLGTLRGGPSRGRAKVWAVELDRTLHAHLEAVLATRHPAMLHLVEGDAVDMPLAALPAARASGCKVVAKLPYAISTPWMDAVLSGRLPGRMVLMLQREAAERYGASPGTGISAQSRYSSRRPMTLPWGTESARRVSIRGRTWIRCFLTS